jgi:hypothetical protein
MKKNTWLKVCLLILHFGGAQWIYAQTSEISDKERTFLKIDVPGRMVSIYFQPNSRDIPGLVFPYLDRLVKFMNENPESTFRLDAYTDSQGKAENNLALSQHRAGAAVAYLVSKGLDPGRFIAKGYGESKPVNACRDGIPCNAAKHSQNRRIELTMTSASEDAKWETLLQTLEKELRASGKSSRSKRLPEANNSVPLPAFKPSGGNN